MCFGIKCCYSCKAISQIFKLYFKCVMLSIDTTFSLVGKIMYERFFSNRYSSFNHCFNFESDLGILEEDVNFFE